MQLARVHSLIRTLLITRAFSALASDEVDSDGSRLSSADDLLDTARPLRADPSGGPQFTH
jgi:hypothetical protein